jgi:hypothetical protein
MGGMQMAINVSKNFTNQSGSKAPEVENRGKEHLARSRRGLALPQKVKQDRAHFAQWWNEYQRKMRVLFDNALLKLQAQGQR